MSCALTVTTSVCVVEGLGLRKAERQQRGSRDNVWNKESAEAEMRTKTRDSHDKTDKD